MQEEQIPLSQIEFCTCQFLHCSGRSDMIDMGMGQQDFFNIRQFISQFPYIFNHQICCLMHSRIDQDQTVPSID